MNDLNDVIDYMKEKKINPLTVDTWGNETNAKIFNILKPYANKPEVVTDEFKINISLKDAGGFGMGEYPAEITISLLVNFK